MNPSYRSLKGRLYHQQAMERIRNRDLHVVSQLQANSSIPYLTYGLFCVKKSLQKAPMAYWEAVRFACKLLSMPGHNKSPDMHRAWRSVIWGYDKGEDFNKFWFHWRVKTAVASSFGGYQFVATKKVLQLLSESDPSLDVYRCLQLLSEPLRSGEYPPFGRWYDTKEENFLVMAGMIYKHDGWYLFV